MMVGAWLHRVHSIIWCLLGGRWQLGFQLTLLNPFLHYSEIAPKLCSKSTLLSLYASCRENERIMLIILLPTCRLVAACRQPTNTK